MTIWGKIIGSATGFALGGPIGALLGGAAGHALDSYTHGYSGMQILLLTSGMMSSKDPKLTLHC